MGERATEQKETRQEEYGLLLERTAGRLCVALEELSRCQTAQLRMVPEGPSREGLKQLGELVSMTKALAGLLKELKGGQEQEESRIVLSGEVTDFAG